MARRTSAAVECARRAVEHFGHGGFVRDGAVTSGGWARVSEMGDGREVRLERVRVAVSAPLNEDARRQARAVAGDLFSMGFLGPARGFEVSVLAVERDSPEYVGFDDVGNPVYAVDLLCAEVSADGERR